MPTMPDCQESQRRPSEKADISEGQRRRWTSLLGERTRSRGGPGEANDVPGGSLPPQAPRAAASGLRAALCAPSPPYSLNKVLSFPSPRPREYWLDPFPQLNLVSLCSVRQIFTEQGRPEPGCSECSREPALQTRQMHNFSGGRGGKAGAHVSAPHACACARLSRSSPSKISWGKGQGNEEVATAPLSILN